MVTISESVSAIINIVGLADPIRAEVFGGLGAASYPIREFASASSFLNEGGLPTAGCIVATASDETLAMQHRLRNALEPAPFILIGTDVRRSVEAVRLGASDVLTQPLQTTLPAAIDEAMRLDKYRREWLRRHFDDVEKVRSLSPRQFEVLGHLAAGKINKIIARDLHLSPRTVEKHRREIFLRLGTTSVADVAVIWDRLKWPPTVAWSLPLECLQSGLNSRDLAAPDDLVFEPTAA